MEALFLEWVCIGSILGAVTTNETQGWLSKDLVCSAGNVVGWGVVDCAGESEVGGC